MDYYDLEDEWVDGEIWWVVIIGYMVIGIMWLYQAIFHKKEKQNDSKIDN